MSKEEIKEIRNTLNTDIEDPEFLSIIYSYVSKLRKSKHRLESDNLKRVCLEEYEDLSERVEGGGFQDSCSVRINLRTRRLANLLVDENGFVNRGVLKHVIEIISQHTYFIGPGRQHDAIREEHLLKMLKLIYESKELVVSLQSISKPYMHPIADQIIKETLQLPPKTTVTNAHARRASLSALLCYLRQALGSCFATAPAIIVHDEQPLQFLADIRELLNTGKLKRTFSGVEYSVPLCHSWGVGDLKRPFYLSGDPEKGAEKLCIQPGLIAAMEMDGGTSFNASLKENMETLRKMLFKFLEAKDAKHQILLLTPESIIKHLLLLHFSVTEEDLKEFDNRSQGMVFGRLMMQSPRAGKSIGGKGEAISRFKVEFERACSAFKSFTDNALLRAWEYSLASFAETKSQFAKWNLYASLGLKHEEPGGIGQCLWSILKGKLDEYNRKVEDHQFEYEQMYAQLKIRENRLKNATSEEEARWLKIDYRAKAHELNVIQEFRDQAHIQAQKIAHLYDILIDFYLNIFPNYFQEIYDPEMLDLSIGHYDDSPAGFRLIYKHGRTNTSQWTFIRNPNQFTESLVSFFMAAERLMDTEEKFNGLEQVLSEITTEVVNHIRTKEFMETALQRMAVAHKTPLTENPLENLDKVQKKPWVYTSGGNLHSLVSVYFRREEKPTSESRWVESPQELLVYFVDTIKKMPYSASDSFNEKPNRSLLTHSPTHAYLLKPGFEMFSEAWKSEDFTYTWVRDKWIIPMERAISEIVVNPDVMQALVKRMLPKIPLNFQPYFNQCFGNLQGSMTAQVFRDYIVYTSEKERGLQFKGKPVIVPSIIDSVLFENLPFFPIYKLQENLERVLSKVPNFPSNLVRKAVEYGDKFSNKVWGESVMGAKQFQEVCKGLIALTTLETSFPINYHKEIKKICELEKLSLPAPIIFADSNWVKDHFAFLVNPGTGKLELWRVDPLGSEGESMNEWSQWLDGSRKHPDWGVFNNPQEYVY
ncbi:MAG: hypothetical protein AAGG81_05245 [Chlamydiota bacterium]